MRLSYTSRDQRILASRQNHICVSERKCFTIEWWPAAGVKHTHITDVKLPLYGIYLLAVSDCKHKDRQNWKVPALASDWSIQHFSHSKNQQYSNSFCLTCYQYRLSHDYNLNTVIPLISSCLNVKFVIIAPSVQSDWRALVLQDDIFMQASAGVLITLVPSTNLDGFSIAIWIIVENMFCDRQKVRICTCFINHDNLHK